MKKAGWELPFGTSFDAFAVFAVLILVLDGGYRTRAFVARVAEGA